MYERRTIGVIVLSKLGLDQFSMLSVRLLELLAAQAAVAFENAQAAGGRAAVGGDLGRAARDSDDGGEGSLGSRCGSAPGRGGEGADRFARRGGGRARDGRRRARPGVVGDGRRADPLDCARGRARRSFPWRGHAADRHRGAAGSGRRRSRAGGVAAVVPVDDALLVVVCSSFSERAQGVLAAVAGQGGLALRSAKLLAGQRSPRRGVLAAAR